MSFPIDWTGAPDDAPSDPFFPDKSGWSKVIISTPGTIISTSGNDFEFPSIDPGTDPTLVPWDNPNDGAANNGTSSASCETEQDSDPPTPPPYFNTVAEALYAYDWGFDIPTGAVIQAVMVSINGRLYDMATAGHDASITPYVLQPFALHVDEGWQYLDNEDYSGLGLDTIRSGHKNSDGSWSGTPVVVGTNEENFTDPSPAFPVASGGLLPFLGPYPGGGGITLNYAQVNDPNFGIGFTVRGVEVG